MGRGKHSKNFQQSSNKVGVFVWGKHNTFENVYETVPDKLAVN